MNYCFTTPITCNVSSFKDPLLYGAPLLQYDNFFGGPELCIVTLQVRYIRWTNPEPMWYVQVWTNPEWILNQSDWMLWPDFFCYTHCSMDNPMTSLSLIIGWLSIECQKSCGDLTHWTHSTLALIVGVVCWSH